MESQQKLYNLGVFNRVTIEPQNANGTDPDKDVVVLVEEAKRYTIAYGGGFEAQRLASTIQSDRRRTASFAARNPGNFKAKFNRPGGFSDPETACQHDSMARTAGV